MEVKDFIITSLQELSENFPNVKFSYVFDKKFDQYIIEVVPSSNYYSQEFAKEQAFFEQNFLKTFPNKDILFVTEGHGLDIPQFEFVINSPTNQVLQLEVQLIGLVYYQNQFH
jgi:hypothetical protein